MKYKIFKKLFQITKLKIEHNPFAKGFRETQIRGKRESDNNGQVDYPEYY